MLLRAIQLAAPIILSGRIVHLQGRDSVPLAGTWVIAHSVSESRQGPVDSMRSDAAGRFHFTIAHADSGAVYVVSARYMCVRARRSPMQCCSPPARS